MSDYSAYRFIRGGCVYLKVESLWKGFDFVDLNTVRESISFIKNARFDRGPFLR